MDVAEFVQNVHDADDEETLAAQLSARQPEKENRVFNLRLRRVTVKDVPDDLRATFTRFYGADLPPEKRVMDILEEDDARAFGPK
jgi:hypothetical protein